MCVCTKEDLFLFLALTLACAPLSLYTVSVLFRFSYVFWLGFGIFVSFVCVWTNETHKSRTNQTASMEQKHQQNVNLLCALLFGAALCVRIYERETGKKSVYFIIYWWLWFMFFIVRRRCACESIPVSSSSSLSLSPLLWGSHSFGATSEREPEPKPNRSPCTVHARTK